MDADERTRLRALCEAATPGPWVPQTVGSIVWEAPGRIGHRMERHEIDGVDVTERANAAFVAACRTVLPALLDAFDAVEQERDALRAKCGAAESALARCEGDGYPLCGPCDTSASQDVAVVHAGVLKVVSDAKNRAEAEVRRLRAILARVVRHEHGNSHGHQRHGVWDASNGPPRGSQPCARCHVFADARTALGLPRWQTCDEPDEDLAPCDGCGCGSVQ